MKLTEEQKLAVQQDGHVLLVACPGSGKTRVILAKLLITAGSVRDTTRRIACITYTNAAVLEIENRLRLHGAGDEDLCEVSTIHAFCQSNILQNFYWRIDEYKNGYSVLPPDSDMFRKLAETVAEKYDLSAFARQQFEQLNRRPSGEPISRDIPSEAAFEFWSLLQQDGYIDFCNIVYYSYHLLMKYPNIVDWLAARFAYFLVDEFQDTSALQVDILSLVAERALTRFFLVGDPEQSIYSFAGAERDMMFQFADKIGAKHLSLSGNFRSSVPIVSCAESLIPRTPPMSACGNHADFAEQPTCHHTEDYFTAITDYFLPTIDALGVAYGNTAILAPSWYDLMPLGKKLREYDVPTVGPGARLYKRSHLFARLGEYICAYVESPRPEFVRYVEKEIFNIVLDVTRSANFGVFSFRGRRAVFRILHAGQRLRRTHEGAVAWLREAAQQISIILAEEEFLPCNLCHLLTESVEDIITEMQKKDVDVANLAVSDVGMFADPENNIKLLTMHAAKGREFTAIALIGLHDGKIPYHNKFTPLSSFSENEARRLFYVAVTRARRVLMFITSQEEWRPPCRFLRELSLIG